MFGVSSSPAPPVTLRRSYAAAVQHTSTGSAAGQSVSRAVLVSAAAVGLGISAAVGGSLLFHSLHPSKNTAPVGSTRSSWWWSVARCLRISSCGHDDDDAFACGTGAENLFDEEKVKARQKLSRSKTKGATRTRAAAGTATAAAGAGTATTLAAFVKPAGPASPVPEAKEVDTALANAEEGREREQYIKLVRALLQREGGVAYDDDDDSSTSSDSTDVSLNYHLATAMEGNARDELMMAFSVCDDFTDGTIYRSAARDVGDGSAKESQLNIMIKTLEYLDMSNEREKLRSRRIAMYREAGRATPVSSLDASGEDEDVSERDGGEDDAVGPMHCRLAARYAAAHDGMTGPMSEVEDGEGDVEDYPSATQRKVQRFQSMLLSSSKMKMPMKDRMSNDDSVLDRILREGTTARVNTAMLGTAHSGYATLRADSADMMEDGWEAEDEDEEAELMAYLQQADNALHFYSREEMRRARRDPANDIRIVGMDSSGFGEDDAESEWEDEMDDEDMAGTEEGDDAEVDEEVDLAAATPWSRRQKRCFERELFARIRHLAERFALTDAMAEWEVSEEEARKQAAREQRRQKGPQSSAKAATDHPPAAMAGDLVEGDDGWEDEADWEDV